MHGNALKWGTQFHGQGDARSAAKALAEALEAAGLRCNLTAEAPERIRIRARQVSGWAKILMWGLPQETDCLVSANGILSVGFVFSLFGWYRVVVLLACLIFTAGLATTDELVRRGWHTSSPWAGLVTGCLFAVSLALCFLPVRLLTALGGHHTEGIKQRFLSEFEKSGGRLSPQAIGGRKHACCMFGYLAYVLLSFLWMFRPEGSVSFNAMPMEVMAELVLALAFASVLLVTGYFLLKTQGLADRMIAMLAGSVGAVGVVFLLSPPVLLRSAQMNAQQFAMLARTASVELKSQAATTSVHFLALLNLGVPAAMVALGSALVAVGVAMALSSQTVLQRLKARAEDAPYHLAVGGGTLVPLFRKLFLTAWTLLTVLILANLALVLAAAVQAIVPSFPFPTHHPAQLMGMSAAVVAGLPPDDPRTEWGARIVWILYGAGVGAAGIASVGQLAIRRRAAWLFLRESGLASERDPLALRLRDTTRQICQDWSWRQVSLPVEAVAPDYDSPHSAASSFGLLGQRRFIEMSQGLLRALKTPEQLGAVVAHELAHHALGHPQRDNLYRWLGRLSFVGDGFARAVQDSFRYEELADRKAGDLGAEEEAFQSSLRLRRHLLAIFGNPPDPPLPPLLSGLEPLLRTIEGRRCLYAKKLQKAGFHALTFSERWKTAWCLFRRQYFRGMELHYWHPTERTRMKSSSTAGDVKAPYTASARGSSVEEQAASRRSES